MCGINGYIAKNKPLSGQKYYVAHCLMANRGPDDEGFSVFESGKYYEAFGDRSINSVKGRARNIRTFEHFKAVLGHVRLSIIDLSDAGHQPMVDTKKKIALAFNGEVYNYRELRAELEKKGYVFRTESDTEVVLYSFEYWGNECFNKFNGMWAIAIYDYGKETLILSRDRFGVKPLFYSLTEDGIMFASEMKVLCALRGNGKVNNKGIEKYLKSNFICDGEETLLEGILEVQPGSVYSPKFEFSI